MAFSKLLTLLLCLSLFGATAQAESRRRRAPRVDAEEAPIVSKIVAIEIEGNKKIESDAIRSRIRSKVGETLDPEMVREDIRSIFGMGYFEEIEVREDDADGGVKLVYVVKEKPIVIKIEYEGLDALDKDEIKDLILIKPYEVLDQGKLRQTADKLTAKYEEKGYYLADVRWKTEEVPGKNEVILTFKIEEHDKIIVKDINIIGNKVLSADELKKVMQTKEGGFFSWITGSGSYRDAVFERDIATLGYYYGTLGYVRARFGKPEVQVSPDKKFISITFYVEEGQQYNVGKVDFTGDLLFSRDELREDMKLVEGEVFSTETLRRETLRYTEKYGDLGYAFANVVPQPNIHDDTRTVDLTFEVDKGDRVYLGKVTITSNTRTKDKVIRRELLIREGELYNGTKKRESRENVIRLGYFDSVEFHQTSSKSNSNVVDIEVKVKERSTGQLVIGAGYASGNIGFTAQAQLSQNNFLGNGQVASLSAQVLTGQKLYEFNLSFTEPYVGSSLWSLGGSLYQIRRNVFATGSIPTFQETKTGFDVRLGHPVREYTNLFLTYKMEYADVPRDKIIDTSQIDPASLNGLSSGVTTNVVYDKRDDRFDPRNGLYLSASTEYAGVGGMRKFMKTRGTVKYFMPIIGDFVFRFHTTAANVARLGDNTLPLNELFIQGGLFSLRGYDFLSIGPQINLSTNPNDLSADAKTAGLAGKTVTIGGRNEVLMNAEIEFPLLKEARIRGVIFFDAGNAFNNLHEPNRPMLYANYGWGFRWFTPIGPLRFEFGYPIVDGGTPKFFFTIGPPF